MGKWSESARNEDTATLKKNIVAYMPLNPSTTAVFPPLPDTKKEERGFNHPMCGRLLSPWATIAKMKEDAAACVAAASLSTITCVLTHSVLGTRPMHPALTRGSSSSHMSTSQRTSMTKKCLTMNQKLTYSMVSCGAIAYFA